MLWVFCFHFLSILTFPFLAFLATRLLIASLYCLKLRSICLFNFVKKAVAEKFLQLFKNAYNFYFLRILIMLVTFYISSVSHMKTNQLIFHHVMLLKNKLNCFYWFSGKLFCRSNVHKITSASKESICERPAKR